MYLNEIYWLLFSLLSFGITVVLYKIFGKNGLYAVIIINIIVCNLQVIKIIELFGITTTLGNILYGSIFFATDALSEIYGKKEAKKGVWLGFAAIVIFTLYMRFTLLFRPSAEDFAHGPMTALFSFLPRVMAASLIAYIISQNFDVWLFNFIKNKTKGKRLWLRNNLSTVISQMIDSVIFVLIAFWGVFESSIIIQILLTTYVFKVIIAAMDTPFIYLIKKIKK